MDARGGDGLDFLAELCELIVVVIVVEPFGGGGQAFFYKFRDCDRADERLPVRGWSPPRRRGSYSPFPVKAGAARPSSLETRKSQCYADHSNRVETTCGIRRPYCRR